jgi:hypothetical protein
MKDAIYEIRLEAKKKKHRYKPQQIPHLTNTCHEYRTNTGSGSAVNLPCHFPQTAPQKAKALYARCNQAYRAFLCKGAWGKLRVRQLAKPTFAIFLFSSLIFWKRGCNQDRD